MIIQSRFQYVLRGRSTALEAKVFASPPESAIVMWYHQETLINAASDARYTTRTVGDIYRLEVNSVSESEVGLYRIVVSLNGMSANDTIMLGFPGMC